MTASLRLPAPLRSTVRGETFVPIQARDLASLPAAIEARYPELAARVLVQGAFGRFVNVFVDGEDVRFLPADTSLDSARVIELLPAMSGGGG